MYKGVYVYRHGMYKVVRKVTCSIKYEILEARKLFVIVDYFFMQDDIN